MKLRGVKFYALHKSNWNRQKNEPTMKNRQKQNQAVPLEQK